MTKHCQNCNSDLNGNFCSHCGQSSYTHRINFHFLWHDIQHGLLHVDKGIFYSIKELFTRPGHSIREFLEGKRVKHFKPISLVLILAGVYGLLSHYFDINMLSGNFNMKGSGQKFNEFKTTFNQVSEWISQHYSIVALLQIPLYSIGTYLCFKKIGYNFIEHLVINAFIAAQKLTIHIVALPFYYFFNNTPRVDATGEIAFKATFSVTDYIGYAVTFWTLSQLFKELSTLQKTGRTLLSLIITWILLAIILIIVGKSIIG
jgi:Protein of unknown function (DUF3667)